MPRSIGWWWMLLLGLCLAPGVGVWAQDAEPPALLPAAPEPSPLLTEPETPEQIFDAVVLLVELARFDLAKAYLDQFVQGNPPDETLLALRDKYGTATFVKLARIRELQGTATPLLERLSAVSRAQAENPAYVEGLMDKLLGSTTDRELATGELRNAGPRAVPLLLRRIAAVGAGPERDTLIFTLTRMGQSVAPVLVAGLDAPIEAVRLASIQTLQRLDYHAAIPALWPLAFADNVDPGTQLAAKRAIAQIRFGNADRIDRLSPVAAVTELTERSRRLLSGAETLADEDDMVELWRWNVGEETVIADVLSPEAANLRMATRHAREALQLSTGRPEQQWLYLLTLLAGEVQRTNWLTLDAAGSQVLASAMSLGAEPLLGTLQEAMALGRTDAAWGAVQALSGLGNPDVLQTRSGRSSPLLSALNYPDPRVQFGAAMAVLRSEPSRSFPNASRVVDVLRRALTDPGQARVLVIDADSERATTVGGFLAEQGYNPLVISTGKGGFTQAAELTGVEFVILHANVMQWDLQQTLANFRADARTEFLPIVIYGPEELRSRLARLVSRTPRSTFVAEAPGSQSFWVEVGPFVRRVAVPPVSGEQRAEFKALAAYWLASITTSSQGRFFDVTPAAAELLDLLDEETLSSNVLTALGTMPGAEVQRRLAATTLNDRLSPAVRIRAAEQLALHIPRFGLVLEPAVVSHLTAEWETSGEPRLKAALAAVVGTLQPSSGLIGERLLRLPAAPVPAGQ
jgi:hypothetical protein